MVDIAEQRLQAADGSSAELEDEAILIRDARGRVVLRFSEGEGLTLVAETGDLRLAAPNGRVVITSGEALLFDAPEIRSVAGRWELIADRAVETVKDAYKSCEGLMQVRATRMRQLLEGAFEVVADRASIRSEEETTIDGKRVLLG
jgi:hypothetical protein